MRRSVAGLTLVALGAMARFAEAQPCLPITSVSTSVSAEMVKALLDLTAAWRDGRSGERRLQPQSPFFLHPGGFRGS
jgi:hypothetical protein